MRQGHMPYGYSVVNGTAVIDEEQSAQVRGVFRDFLDGVSYARCASNNGFQMYHASVKRMLRNRYYLGDDFYPPLIDREIFDAAEAEYRRRVEALGRKNRRKTSEETKPVPTAFRMKPDIKRIRDPYKQAEYAYSLIESEE
mgnify:CR=1 FL=1|jgi:hypothetical protein